ncbi:hypothetical protein MKX03_016171 [Papaver bracteatum]|nr:hypothetical protein MKX03_016171 [Papaver bracteatum]
MIRVIPSCVAFTDYAEPIIGFEEMMNLMSLFDLLVAYKDILVKELLSMILKELKRIAEESLATKQAATMAGFRESPVPMSVLVTQHAFVDAFKEWFKKCEEAIGKCLQDSRISKIHQVILVGGSTKIPRIRDILRAFWLCKIVDPDNAVVQGAAALSGVALTNLLLNGISTEDVAPLSLSARGQGLTFGNFIPRNAVIPLKRKGRFTTYRDNQRRLYLGVHEGEEATVRNNNLIGYFIFDGIQAAESFAVDHDGILNVSAAEDESQRQMAEMENPAQEVEEESRRNKLEAAELKVWLFTQYMSREVPDDFSMGFSPSWEERLQEAQEHAERRREMDCPK